MRRPTNLSALCCKFGRTGLDRPRHVGIAAGRQSKAPPPGSFWASRPKNFADANPNAILCINGWRLVSHIFFLVLTFSVVLYFCCHYNEFRRQRIVLWATRFGGYRTTIAENESTHSFLSEFVVVICNNHRKHQTSFFEHRTLDRVRTDVCADRMGFTDPLGLGVSALALYGFHALWLTWKVRRQLNAAIRSKRRQSSARRRTTGHPSQSNCRSTTNAMSSNG